MTTLWQEVFALSRASHHDQDQQASNCTLLPIDLVNVRLEMIEQIKLSKALLTKAMTRQPLSTILWAIAPTSKHEVVMPCTKSTSLPFSGPHSYTLIVPYCVVISFYISKYSQIHDLPGYQHPFHRGKHQADKATRLSQPGWGRQQSHRWTLNDLDFLLFKYKARNGNG